MVPVVVGSSWGGPVWGAFFAYLCGFAHDTTVEKTVRWRTSTTRKFSAAESAVATTKLEGFFTRVKPKARASETDGATAGRSACITVLKGVYNSVGRTCG